MNKPERVKCQCPCHKHRVIKHVVPCCDNGWIELPTLPAPTVATDNKTKEHDCEFFLVTDVAVYACECDPHHILIDNQEYIPVASPVEEEQEELWMEAINLIDMTTQNRAVEMLKEKFILTRKS